MVPCANHHVTGHVKRGDRGLLVSIPNHWEYRPLSAYALIWDHCSSMFLLTQDCPWKTIASLTLPMSSLLPFLKVKSHKVCSHLEMQQVCT